METIFTTLFAALGIICLATAGILLLILVASYIKFAIKEIWNKI
jgi:hypothetical protein